MSGSKLCSLSWRATGPFGTAGKARDKVHGNWLCDASLSSSSLPSLSFLLCSALFHVIVISVLQYSSALFSS